MKAPHWVANLERWPVALLEVVGSDCETPPVFATFIAAFEQIFARPGPCAVVFDITHARPDAARRAATTTFLRENEARIRAKMKRLAVVAPTAQQRGLVTALQWAKVDYGVRAFDTRAEALVWARLGMDEGQ
jgi:hypothetical protein